MKKKSLKSLKLNKKSVSKLEDNQLTGGFSIFQSIICSNANSCDINTPHICP